jgi:hypothetical protein
MKTNKYERLGPGILIVTIVLCNPKKSKINNTTERENDGA